MKSINKLKSIFLVIAVALFTLGSCGKEKIEKTFGIELSQTDTYSFQYIESASGYTVTPLTITVTNTGNQATGALQIVLGGVNPGSFDLSPSTGSIVDIEAGKTATFTVAPKLSLYGDNYSATVTVCSDNNANIAARSFTVTFSVEEEQIIGHPPIMPGSGMDLYGSIIDTDGFPIAGVVVSDGFQCVSTDKRGVYQMKRSSGARFVFYSTPAEYEIATLSEIDNSPVFFSTLDATIKRYNFALKKLPTVEREFNLLCIGDPQVDREVDITRYTNETLADMKEFVDASAKPCYGLVLGDVTNDRSQFFTTMRTLNGSTDMKVFVTIGNHDKTGGDAITPRNADAFCSVYGPLDYSFNRGDVHFVCLDNVGYTNNTNYNGGFEDHQIEWLRQNLSFVPKDKLIIVYYHIPIRTTTSIKNRTGFLDALKDFSKAHFMAGHTHYNENFFIPNGITIHEHIHAASCGAWWFSNINLDGTPNGYAVYEVNGAEFTNWYYKSTRYDRNFQIRLHRGDTQFGGSYGSFSYNQPGKMIANIWNADPNWKIEAYEDGVFAGNLTLSSAINDAFAAGYHMGVRGGASGSIYDDSHNKHAYIHTLKNPSAIVIEINATDRFGTVYKQSEIISNLNTADKYPQEVITNILINGQEMQKIDDENFQIDLDLTQNGKFIVESITGIAGWWIDPDFFAKVTDNEYTFLPITGRYRITAHTGMKYFRVQVLKGDDPAITEDDGTGAIWVQGQVGKPSHAANPVIWDLSKTLCMAPMGDKKYQLTLVGGVHVRTNDLGFKFSARKNLWNYEFGYTRYPLTATPNDIFTVRPNDGMLDIIPGVTLEYGATYVFVIDLSGGIYNAVLSVTKK